MIYLDVSLVRVDVTCFILLGGPEVAAAAGLLRDRVANPCSTSALVELCGRLLRPTAKQQMFHLQMWRNKLRPLCNKIILLPHQPTTWYRWTVQPIGKHAMHHEQKYSTKYAVVLQIKCTNLNFHFQQTNSLTKPALISVETDTKTKYIT